MENENDNIIESQNDEQELDLDLDATTEDDKAAPSDGETGEKPKLSPEEKRAKLEGIYKRLGKKLGYDKPADKKDDPKPEPKSQPSELGYAEKAYASATYGIKGEKEFALLQEWMADTGKKLETVLENNRFQGELKDLREATDSANAVPRGTKRSSSSPKDSVDYWLDKPTQDIPQDMRIKVVNARIAREKAKGNI
jgi:hypothetical protein